MKVIRWFAIGIGTLLGLLVLAVATVMVFGITLNLNVLRGPVEQAATQALGRELRIEGDVLLVPTLIPSLEIRDVKLGNPEGWPQADFASLATLRAQLALTPLLDQQLVIGELTAEGLRADLVRNNEGKGNWSFGKSAPKEEGKPEEPESAGEKMRLVAVGELGVRGLEITYTDQRSGKRFALHLDELSGAAPQDEALRLAFNGTLQGQAYEAQLDAGPLNRLFTSEDSWPVDLEAQITGVVLELKGALEQAASDQPSDIGFKLEATDTRQLEAVLDAALPGIEQFVFQGRLLGSDTGLKLTDVTGAVGETRLNAAFEVKLDRPIPYLFGDINFELLDLEPFRRDAEQDLANEESTAPETAAEEAEPDAPVITAASDFAEKDLFFFNLLRDFEMDVGLKVAKVNGIPGGVSDASLSVKVEGGELSAPMGVAVAGVSFSGEATIKEDTGTPVSTIDLSASSASIADLANLFLDARDVAGRFGNAELHLDTRGSKLRDLAANFTVGLLLADAELSYGNEAGARPIDFSLENARFDFDLASGMTAKMNGALLKEAFSLQARAGNLLDAKRTVSMTLQGPGSEVVLQGTYGTGFYSPATRLQVQARAERLGDLSAWLGVAPQTATGFELQSELIGADDGVELALEKLALGVSSLSGRFRWQPRDGEPFLGVDLRAETLDLKELMGTVPAETETDAEQADTETETEGAETPSPIPVLAAEPWVLGENPDLRIDQDWQPGAGDPLLGVAPMTGTPAELQGVLLQGVEPYHNRVLTDAAQPEMPASEPGGGLRIDVPLLPRAVSILDADLALEIGSIPLAKFAITDVKIDTGIRGAYVERSPFQATVAEMPLTGDFSLDLRTATPRAGFMVAAEDIDVGGLLGRLEVAEGLEASAKSMQLSLDLAGANAEQLLRQSAFSAELESGSWTLRDANSGASAVVQVGKAVFAAEPGKNVTVQMNGGLAGMPVTMTMESGALQALLRGEKKVGLAFTVKAADAVLKANSRVALPLSSSSLALAASLEGSSISSFNEWLGVDLPPFGPYLLAATFATEQNGYRLSDLKLQVGESELSGELSLDTSGGRPVLDVDLTASRFQIDDFPLKRKPAAEQEARPEDRKPDKTDTAKAKPMFSPDVLNALDARFSLTVNEVLSGRDRLGGGELKVGLQQGRLAIEPLRIDVPGGSVQINSDLRFVGKQVEAGFKAHIERFDYGVLARRIKPETEMDGTLSLDLDLRSTTPDLESTLAHANGHLDFALWPDEFEAGIIDLWAVNVIMAVASKADPEDRSLLNCVVARFDIRDGYMEQQALLLDTSNMQVEGTAVVNFKQETVDVYVEPEAKKPQMFSLQTPIGVSGTFEDLGIKLEPGAVIGTVFRFITSPVAVPFQRLAKEKLPKDGTALCEAAMRR